ncbi:MAG: hypothetical protein ACHRHE_11450 [Tepidisphaerales bacterium]
MRIQSFCFLTLLLALGAGGCSSGRGGEVRLEPSDGARAFSQVFNYAFFAVNEAGDFDIVMVDNASAWQFKKPPRKGAIKPQELTPVRQAFQIRSNWKQRIGTKRNPASTNASITWYVLGESGANDIIVYKGVANVMVYGDPTDDTCSVEIREGTLEPEVVSGDMRDPVGPASIRGQCDARRRDSQVHDILSDMESRRRALTSVPSPATAK